MQCIQLSADLSDVLLRLLSEEKELVDAVEVGPWFTMQQIRAYKRRLPDTPFYFHAADMIESIEDAPGSQIPILEYLICTKSPWVSVHISVWESGEIQQMKNGKRLPLPEPESSMEKIIKKVNLLRHSKLFPVLIENVEPLPFEGYDYWAKPDFIDGIVRETDCDFLLDTGHARISAHNFGMEIQDYICQLPLDRVVQVHVSGPRLVNGQFMDVHQPLQDEDYELLEDVLARTHPQVVTLEYLQETQALREQLNRLRNHLTKE